MKALKLSFLCATIMATGCSQLPIRTVHIPLPSTPQNPSVIDDATTTVPQSACAITMYNPQLDQQVIATTNALNNQDSVNVEAEKQLQKMIARQERKHERKQRKECERHASYQIKIPVTENNTLKANMFILEINDQGVIVNPEIKNDILKHLRTEMAKENKPNVSLFVHGWNNNADANNTDLINFEKAVALLKTSNDPKADATGIYVSWRAKTLPTGAHVVTFWDRKAISEEVGRGELANFIFELESVVKPNDDAKKQGQLVLAGHSFGASALYNAVGHTLTARFYDSLENQKKDPNQPIRGIGDIVILLNPAIEALRFRGLREAVYEKANTDPTIFKNNKSPIMVVLASEDDIHVETAFPIGRLMGHLFTHYSQKEIKVQTPTIVHKDTKVAVPLKSTQRQSIGFFEPYYTHYVANVKKPTAYSSDNSKQVMSNVKDSLDKPKEVISNVKDTLNQVPVIKDTALTKVINPKYIFEQFKDTLISQRNKPINYQSCLSEDAKAIEKIIQDGIKNNSNAAQNAARRDWYDIIYAKHNKNENSENFSTKFSSLLLNKEANLFNFQITNNPALFSEDIKNSWDLVKNKPDQPLTWRQNPYWFVKARSDFMRGHNGIWNSNVGCMLMVLMTTSSKMPLQAIKTTDIHPQQLNATTSSMNGTTPTTTTENTAQ